MTDGSAGGELNDPAEGGSTADPSDPTVDDGGRFPIEYEPQRSKRPLWLIIGGLVVLAFVFVAFGRNSGGGHTIEGAFLLADKSGDISGPPEDCRGDGGYSDISGGQSIKVTNGSGDIIGAGTLENVDTEEKRDLLLERWHATGFMDKDEDEHDFDKFLDSADGIICFMVFEVDVPKSEFYEIQIGGGDRGNLSYSLHDLEEKDWRVSVTIGDL